MDPELLEKMPNESICKCIPAWLRYVLFIVTFIVGFSLCTGSLGQTDNKLAFYLMWCIGVICAWLGSVFIKSFKKQFERMFKTKDNLISNIIIIVCFIAVIVIEAVAPYWYAIIVPYILCFAALVYYSLSLIPGFQACVKNCFKSCFSCCCK